MKVRTVWAKRKAKVNLLTQTDLLTMVTSEMIKSMDAEKLSIILVTFTADNGKRGACVGMESTHMPAKKSTKVNSQTIKNTALEFLFRQMVACMRVSGERGNSMDLELKQKKTEKLNMESGKMERP